VAELLQRAHRCCSSQHNLHQQRNQQQHMVIVLNCCFLRFSALSVGKTTSNKQSDQKKIFSARTETFIGAMSIAIQITPAPESDTVSIGILLLVVFAALIFVVGIALVVCYVAHSTSRQLIKVIQRLVSIHIIDINLLLCVSNVGSTTNNGLTRILFGTSVGNNKAITFSLTSKKPYVDRHNRNRVLKVYSIHRRRRRSSICRH
jgi:hypothetical protein